MKRSATSAGSATVYPVASETDYANSDGSGGRTTSYSYTWFSGTNLVQSETVTLPTVSTAENGPGTADSETTYFDIYGNAIWHKDGDGFLTYAAYDAATAAVTKTIADVDASGLWPGRVVTEVAPAGDFWEAEPEHQDYLERYPDGYTCHFVRPNWKLK